MATTRLLYVVTHPIQYQAPLLRRIARQPDIDLRVLFQWVQAEGGYFDAGFGRRVEWDVPLREGYSSALISEVDLDRELAAADAVWLHGWQSRVLRGVLRRARALGCNVLMRGENWDGAMPDGPGLRGWLKRRYLDRIFACCTAFLAVGTVNREYYLRRGIEPERIFTVPYAVDNEFYAARAAEARPLRESFRKSLGLPPGRQVVLYAGKLMRRKHPEWLLQAWEGADWPEERGRPVLVYVGEGEMRADLERRASRDVHFLGFRNQSELPAFYDLADVFALPSENEPWGLTVNEAMASRTAVVASDQVGSAYDLIDDGCGAVFPAGDIGAFAAALVRVAADAEKLGAAAFDRVSRWDYAADIEGLRQALAWLREGGAAGAGVA